MSDYGGSDDQQPVIWIGGRGVYAAYFVALVFTASMILTTILNFLRLEGLTSWLLFASAAVWRGEIWRIFTYGLVNQPSLWFVVDMLMLAWFGRELEKFFGRRAFLSLYGGLYLVLPLIFTLVGRWRPTELEGESAGFAVFVAFAALYPDAVLIFNLLAKWVALVLLGIYSLIAMSSRDPVAVISLWSTSVFAFAFVRCRQGRWPAFRLRLWPRGQKLRVLPDLPANPAARASAARADSMAEMDALLDKIARSGLLSLTAKERAKLDRARADLLRRGSGNG